MHNGEGGGGVDGGIDKSNNTWVILQHWTNTKSSCVTSLDDKSNKPCNKQNKDE